MTASERYEGLVGMRTEIECVWFNDAGELNRGRFEQRMLRMWIPAADQHAEKG